MFIHKSNYIYSLQLKNMWLRLTETQNRLVVSSDTEVACSNTWRRTRRTDFTCPTHYALSFPPSLGNHKVTRSQGHKVTRSQGHKVTGHKVTCRNPCAHSFPLSLGKLTCFEIQDMILNHKARFLSSILRYRFGC